MGKKFISQKCFAKLFDRNEINKNISMVSISIVCNTSKIETIANAIVLKISINKGIMLPSKIHIHFTLPYKIYIFLFTMIN